MALNNVPLPGQTLAASRDPINQNFVTIDTAFSADHVSYGASGAGFHNKITFTQQPPTPSFSATQIGLYNIVSPLTTFNELFVVKAAGTATPVTATSNDAGGAFQTSGYYYLPSGLLVKWGSFTNISVDANDRVTVQKNFPLSATIPVFSTIYSVQLTLGNNENPGKPWEAIVTLDQYNSDNTKLSISINNQSAALFGFPTGLLRIYYTAIGI